MDGDFVDKSILVYGSRKSGTTLLQNLLDGSSRIMMIPDELKIKFVAQKILSDDQGLKGFYLAKGRSSFRNFLEVIVKEKRYDIRIKKGFKFGNITDAQLAEKFDLKRYINGLKRLANDPTVDSLREMYARDVMAFKEALRFGGSFTYWASKEVGSMPELIVTHFKSIFPQAKFVFIAREPKMVVRSVILKRRRKGIKLPLTAILRECFQAQKVISYYVGLDQSGHSILIFYEDLVKHLTREMKRIARFLDIPWEPILERPSLFGIDVKVRTSSQNTTTVFPEKADWRRDLEFREKMAILLFNFAHALFAKLAGKERSSYQKLIKMATEQGKSAAFACSESVRYQG